MSNPPPPTSSSISTPPHIRALQNRAIRAIHTELDFLLDTHLLSTTDIHNILSLLPTLPPASRAATPVAPVSPPRSPDATPSTSQPTPSTTLPQTPQTPDYNSLLHRQTPLPSSATPAFPLRQTPLPSSATPAHEKPGAGPPPPSHMTGGGQGMIVQALWAYPGPGNSAAQGDLTFDVGDTIEVVERTNADWWLGRRGGVTGLFPAGFVREVEQQERGRSGWMPGVGGGIGGVAGNERGPGGGSGSGGQQQGVRKTWVSRYGDLGGM